MESDKRYISKENWLAGLRKRLEIELKEPAQLPMAKEAACPRCSSQDWKLVQLVYAAGLTRVHADTEGEGSSIGMGLGRGRGGVDVESFDYEESTWGQHQTELSRRHAPPSRPKESGTETMRELLDKLRYHTHTMNRNWSSNNRDIKRVKEILTAITLLELHHRELELWKRTCVCNRCGTKFLVHHIQS